VRASAHGFYLAAFNYDDKQPQTVHIPLERVAADLARGAVSVEDIANGSRLATAQGEIVLELQPAESKLIEIRRDPSVNSVASKGLRSQETPVTR
jgi:hypothetical protein